MTPPDDAPETLGCMFLAALVTLTWIGIAAAFVWWLA